VKPLLELVPDAKYPLRLVEADLSKADSWAKAVNRCTYVFHVASPFIINVTDEAAIIHTAVEGTTNVLQACADAGTVKRVVVTSSIAAVSCGTFGNPGKPADYVYTEKDWSPEAGCAPYEKSKLKAEQAAWDFIKKLDDGKRFELAVVNPAYVQGPLLSASSGEGSKEMCDRLLSKKMPALPDLSFPIIDVRDVAAAHIAAMEKGEAAGNRHVLTNRTIHITEFAKILRDEFQPQGYTIPSEEVPKSVEIPELAPMLGKVMQYNNERMVKVLGIQPRPVEESLIDTCYSLIDFGLTEKTSEYLGHPSTRSK
jgi:nucleoside-diphosphate-sugar epimerase